jgi:hypothetical protein
MNNIPYTSYIFIGITSLVLTYATIADTEKEIIIEPTEEAVPESVSVPEAEASAEINQNQKTSTEPVEAKLVSTEGGKKRKTKKHRKKHKKSRKSKN